MTNGTRFGKKLKVPATFQLKHQFLIWWLKQPQQAKEAAEPDARVVPQVPVPMYVHHAGD
jgi:hypothetical protein